MFYISFALRKVIVDLIDYRLGPTQDLSKTSVEIAVDTVLEMLGVETEEPKEKTS